MVTPQEFIHRSTWFRCETAKMFKENPIPSSPFPLLPQETCVNLLGVKSNFVMNTPQLRDRVSSSVEHSDTMCLSALKVVVKIYWTCLIGFQKCGIILMKSWKNIANRIPLLVSILHQNASLVVNDCLEGFSHNEVSIRAKGISKKSILLWARKGKKL